MYDHEVVEKITSLTNSCGGLTRIEFRLGLSDYQSHYHITQGLGA